MQTIKRNTASGYTVIHPEGDAPTSRFEIHFQGFRGLIDRNEGETDGQVWERALSWLYQRRLDLQRQKSLLDPHGHATIYAGTLTPDCANRLFAEHLREIILHRVAEEANNRRDGTGTSRVAALQLLTKLHGIAPPKRLTAKQQEIAKRVQEDDERIAAAGGVTR
jgi:hypothetical protein